MNLNKATVNKEELHHEALKTLCALQQYMGTLHNQKPNERQINYFLSFQLMNSIVNILYKTLEKQEYTKYPTELLLIENNIQKIIGML